ncbi:MAG: porin family protein [Saprospiraceae bacterium]
MKKILFLSAFLFIASLSFSQVKFGIRGGFSTANVDGNKIGFPSGSMDTLSISDITGGYHFGFFLQARMKKFFIQPEIVFNSNKADFTLSDLSSPEGRDQVLTERYNYLDIPIMMGLKLGALRLQAGPVGHVYLDSKSDLLKFDEYSTTFETITYGYQTGIGLDIWNIALDVKYEGNFSDFDDHIRIDNEKINLSNAPSRWIFSIGVAF